MLVLPVSVHPQPVGSFAASWSQTFPHPVEWTGPETRSVSCFFFWVTLRTVPNCVLFRSQMIRRPRPPRVLVQEVGELKTRDKSTTQTLCRALPIPTNPFPYPSEEQGVGALAGRCKAPLLEHFSCNCCHLCKPRQAHQTFVWVQLDSGLSTVQ